MSTLIFDLLWRDRGVVRGMNSVADATDKAERRAKAFKVAVGVGLVAAGAAAIKFGRNSVAAYKESEAAQLRLEDAFAKFPKLANTNITSLRALNTQLAAKTRFDDDATASGQAVLAQFKLTGTQITQLTPLLQDYAAKTGKDLPTAAKDLGRAVMGQGRALKVVGLDLKDTGSATGNLNQLMGGLRKQVGGFAEREGKSAAGQAAILRNQFGELEETAGAALVPALNKVVGGLIQLVGFAQKNAAVIGPLIGVTAGLAAAIWLANKAGQAWAVTQGLTAGIATKAVGGLSALKLAFTGTALSATAAGRAMKIAQLSIPLVGIALFAVTSAMQFFAKKSDDGSTSANGFADAMQSVQGNVTRATAALNENVRAQAVSALQSKGAYDQAKLLGLSYATVTDAALGNKDAIREVNRVLSVALALNPQVSKANSDQRNAASHLAQSLGGVARESSEATEQERIRRSAMSGSATATDELKTKTNQLKGAQRDLNTELQKSIDKFTILKEGALSTERANLAWEESIDAVRQSTKENGKSLDAHTAKGRSNRGAVVNMITALNDKVTADVKNAGAVRKGESAQDRYERVLRVATSSTKKGESAIRAAGRAAGLNEGQVNKMIKQYLKTPKQIKTDVEADTKTARQQIQKLKERIAELEGKSVTANTTIKFSPDKLAKSLIKGDYFNNPGAFKAAGGPIQNLSGRGRPGRDTEPILAAVGEHMWTDKEVAASGGHQAMYRMRKAALRGELHGMADGGPVVNRRVDVRHSVPRWSVNFPKMMNELSDRAGRAGVRYGEKIGLAWAIAAKKKAAEVAAAVGSSASWRGGSFRGLSNSQMNVAATIASVGAAMGKKAQLIGLIAGKVESDLTNVNYGDRDSLGVFQQRAPWGPASVRRNVRASAGMFFHGGRGGQRGLDDIGGWRGMSPGRAAQRVQVSAFPGRYATQVPLALSILTALTAGKGAAALAGSGRGGSWMGGTRPVPGSARRHSGYPWANWAGDFKAGGGTPIRAWKAGYASAVNRWGFSYGNHVRAKHAGGSETLSAHMSRPAVRRGQRFGQGAIIGYVGSTGNATGNHLHWEVKGMGRGGVMRRPSIVGVSENGPERILSAPVTRTFERMVRVMERGGGGAGNTYVVNVTAPNFVGSTQDLANTLVQMGKRGQLDVIYRGMKV